MHSSPVSSSERLIHLDVLRGFALLGILVMNIQGFSMPLSAYMNPTTYGDLTGANAIIWSVSNLFADMKFMSLFSMLFGAGIILFVERAMAKEGSAAALHYKRNFWLVIFGLIHAHFIWFGDILFAYGFTAFILFFFRNLKTRGLIIWAIVFLGLASLYNLMAYFAIITGNMPDESIEMIMSFWDPGLEAHAAEIAAYTGTYAEQFAERSKIAIFMQVDNLPSIFLRVGGMMLIGMALYKSGALTGKRTPAFYYKLLMCLPIGVAITAYGQLQNTSNGFSMEYSMFMGIQYNYWGSVLTALGYVAMFNIILEKGLLSGLCNRLAAVGRMAFTNYIMHSLVCTFIFYGIGLGLFGQFSRVEQILLVVTIWAVQLVISPMILRVWRFGPLEWLWRSLTYMKLQPFKR